MFAGILGSIGIKLALLGILAMAAGGFYWHYTIVKGERDDALAMVGALAVIDKVQKATINNQKKAIANWVEAQKQLQITLNALAENQVRATETIRRLNDVLSKHDLHALSLAKPGLIERRINRGTAGILKLFEDETSDRSDSRRDGDKAARPQASSAKPTAYLSGPLQMESAYIKTFAKGRPVGVLCDNPKRVRNAIEKYGGAASVGKGSQVAARLLSRERKTGWTRRRQNCTKRWPGLTNAPAISLTVWKSMSERWPRTKTVIVRISRKFTLESLLSIRGLQQSPGPKTGCSGLALPGCSS